MAKSQKTNLKKSEMTEAEIQRRAGLHQRFVSEIDSLKDKAVHVVVFSLGQEQFAIEISKVNRVIVTPKITRLPKTPDYIPGVAQIGKSSVVIIDLVHKLGLVPKEGHGAYTIIVSSSRFTIGILVPEVPSNLKVIGSQIQAAGLDLAGTSEDETYIKGLIHTEESTLYFIDIDELIEGDRMEARAVISS